MSQVEVNEHRLYNVFGLQNVSKTLEVINLRFTLHKVVLSNVPIKFVSVTEKKKKILYH